MNKLRNLVTAVFISGLLFMVGCGGGEPPKANTAKTDAPKTDAPKTDAPKTDAPKTDVTTADSIGVAECDEYIKKYEACLLKIAEKAPQVKDSMKSSFETSRNAWKQAASTAQGKASLGSTCKQMIETAKQSTAAYSCEW